MSAMESTGDADGYVNEPSLQQAVIESPVYQSAPGLFDGKVDDHGRYAGSTFLQDVVARGLKITNLVLYDALQRDASGGASIIGVTSFSIDAGKGVIHIKTRDGRTMTCKLYSYEIDDVKIMLVGAKEDALPIRAETTDLDLNEATFDLRVATKKEE